jgi:hypothetical protein
VKRALSVALLSMLLGSSALAEDSVAIYGNYYKERSTRIVSPMITVRKDLPLEADVEATYLVDQITSASGAFGVTSDAAFQEYRQEVRFAAGKRFGDVRPSLSLRYSGESDYRSFAVGGQVAVELFDKNTILQAQVAVQHDIVDPRDFRDKLDTTFVGVAWSQLITPELIVGLNLETQILSGYTENFYRVENHPRERNRYIASIFGNYRIDYTKTTIHGAYRLYADSWDLVAHTFDLEVTQRLLPSLEIAPRLRAHTQDDVYFSQLTPDNFLTTDPKLFAFGSGFYGVRLIWKLWFLDDTFLQGASIEPSYALLVQGTRYGTAHIAQLGGYWPF